MKNSKITRMKQVEKRQDARAAKAEVTQDAAFQKRLKQAKKGK